MSIKSRVTLYCEVTTSTTNLWYLIGYNIYLILLKQLSDFGLFHFFLLTQIISLSLFYSILHCFPFLHGFDLSTTKAMSYYTWDGTHFAHAKINLWFKRHTQIFTVSKGSDNFKNIWWFPKVVTIKFENAYL